MSLHEIAKKVRQEWPDDATLQWNPSEKSDEKELRSLTVVVRWDHVGNLGVAMAVGAQIMHRLEGFGRCTALSFGTYTRAATVSALYPHPQSRD